MKIFLFVIALSCAVLHMDAQTARIQFIHNSPDFTISAIDIYVDGVLKADSLMFHEATPFMNVTAGVESTISVCPGTSVDASEAFYTLPYTFIASEKYVCVSSGMTQPGYSPQVFFALNIHAGALEAGTNTSATDVLFCHANTDIEVVDVTESDLLLLPLFEDVFQGSFQGFQSFLTADYIFEIGNANNGDIIGRFAAPFGQYNMGGLPVTIVSSGFLNQHANLGGEAFGLWLAKPLGGMMIQLPLLELNLFAGFQLIHNSADPQANNLDVYINQELFAENLSFRHASPMINVQAAQEVVLGLAQPGSSSSEDCFFRDTISFLSGDLVTGLLIGNMSDVGFDPVVPMELQYISRTPDPGQVSLLFAHGSPDFGVVDLLQFFPEPENWVNDIGYAQSSSQWFAGAQEYQVELTSSDGSSSEGFYILPLMDLAGQMLTVVLSGYDNPTSNHDGPQASLWMAADAGGPLQELLPPPPAPVYTQVQFIHNCADEAIAEIDIYADGVLILNNLSFHAASPYINLLAEVPLDISVAMATSTSVDESFVNFTYVLNENSHYLFIADGIYSMTGYNPSPDFQFSMYEGARPEAAIASHTDVIVYQGCTDLPPVLVRDQSDLSVWSPTMLHQDFSDYQSLLPGTNHGVALMTNTGNITLGEYGLYIQDPEWTGKSVTLLVNGFLNPLNNSDGQNLQCWYALADGTTGMLGNYVGLDELAISTTKVFPVPAHDKLFVRAGEQFVGQMDAVVFSSDGKMIDNAIRFSSESLFELNLLNLSPGLYVMKLTDGRATESVHFVVE